MWGVMTALRHLCGLRWCQNPFHFAVGTQEENLLKAECHYWLSRFETLEEFIKHRLERCGRYHRPQLQPGEQQCWTNRYDQRMLRKDRLSLTVLSPAERPSLEELAAEPEQNPTCCIV